MSLVLRPAEAVTRPTAPQSSPQAALRSLLGALLSPAWLCVLSAAALTALGVYAIDVAAVTRPLVSGELAGVAWKQVGFAVVGVIAAATIAVPHSRIMGLIAWPFFGVCLALLVFLLLPGVPSWLVTPRNGARGWIDLGPIDLQPGELTKIAYVLVIAGVMRRRVNPRRLRGLLIPAAITAVPAGLITIQPDLGTASLFVPSLFAMLIVAGARLRHLALVVVIAALAAPAAYPLLRDHQKERIVGLIQQFKGDRSTEQDINFQSFTAQTLVAAGGVAGTSDVAARALVRYNRLPERHNDTIFAVIVTRLGLVGGGVVLGLYAVWVVAALVTAGLCKDTYGRLVGVGFAGFIAAQVVINVGMNIGLLPIIGITLPFVSYGGSSLVTTWLMTGLIMNAALHRGKPSLRGAFEYPDGYDRAQTTGRPGDKTIGAGWRGARR